MHYKLIRNSFDKSSNSYDDAAFIQRGSALELLGMLKDRVNLLPIKNIFDVGSGTGYICEQLLRYLPEADYTLNDMSSNMLEIAKKKFFNRKNFIYDNSNIESATIAPYDLITSNMCLQWVDDLEVVVKKLYASSKVLLFSCLIEGTFSKWYKKLTEYGVCNAAMRYPDKQSIFDLINVLSPKYYNVQTKKYNLSFEKVIDAIKYLKMLGANSICTDISIHKLVNMIKKDKNGCTLEYNTIFILIEK